MQYIVRLVLMRINAVIGKVYWIMEMEFLIKNVLNQIKNG